jgi:hypothetical protein
MAWTIDALGWLGMLLYVVAYALVSSGRLDGRSGRFQGLNIAAALLVGANAAYHGAYPSFAVNVVWFSIGLFTVGGLRRRRRRVATRSAAGGAPRLA